MPVRGSVWPEAAAAGAVVVVVGEDALSDGVLDSAGPVEVPDDPFEPLPLGCWELPLPNGSTYWSSPAPPDWASAAPGAIAMTATASAAAMRRRADTSADSRPRSLRSTLMARHVLLLTDRDWTHPQGGGTGTNLYGQVTRWLAWGHRVTVIAGDYPGAEKVEHLSDRLTIHRMGTRLTVFPRAALAVWRGVGRDADVALEVVNGIAFFTPLWWFLRAPRVAIVHHVHQDHYVEELGRRGRIAAFLLERLPLRHLYGNVPVLTISQAAHDDLVELGVPSENVHVAYLGVEPSQFHPGRRAERPTLLYLGRLKAYKRIEVVLDVLEHVPEAVLEIAGDGDHRAALEAEIDRRGLHDRVTLHGHVSEQEKADLYGRAWVNLTASSAEGWCLSVMEAAACGTPSAALAVGGLAESIVDEQTGLLAHTPAELADRVAALVRDPERRDELGAAAEARARSFTWENTAQANMTVLEHAADGGQLRLRDAVARSQTGKAAGLAGATLANNALQLIFTFIFTRMLGAGGYGSLAALVSGFLILLVGGQSVQAAAAREMTLGHMGAELHASATLRAWSRRLLELLVGACAVSVLLRVPIAHLVGVPEHPWAAAAILPTGVLWMLLSLQRGALQGLHAYQPLGVSLIAEAALRIVFALILVAAGGGVTGAFLGTPIAFAAVALGLGWLLHDRLRGGEREERVRPLRSLIGREWGPVLGLLFLGVLQNVDVIMGKHQLGGDRAGSYAAAAVAAKAVLWVAIGVGLHLLPEATRRAAAGLDPRPVLLRALAVLGVVAVPALALFAAVPHLLLKVAFGEKLTQASDALFILGVAMTLLAVAYLTVQYMLALGEARFLWVLGVVAIVEPFLLSAGNLSLLSFSAIVLGLQCLAASGVLAIGWRARVKPQAT
jgi:glycosyltransferase involved in cell wall biosynthesis/O-antigen/teichoic acid export membrane protein